MALNEVAVAHDADGAAALEGTLRTTALNGSPESPVTNARLIVKNTSGISYAFVSGVVTFYDSASRFVVAKGSSKPTRLRQMSRSRLTLPDCAFVARPSHGALLPRTCCRAWRRIRRPVLSRPIPCAHSYG